MDREKIITEIEDALSGNLAKVGRIYRMSLNGLKDKALNDALSLLKEQDGLMLALEQSNAANEYLNAEVERLTGLLEEQEARILDLDELEDWENAVWFEDKYEHECYIALIANVGTYDATFVNAEPGKYHRFDFLREFYKKEWRCWSARPTIKQRKAVKWE